MATQKPLYQRTWFIVTMSFLLLGIIGSALNGGNADTKSEAAPTETVTVTATPSESATETPSPSPSNSADPSVAQTAASSDADSASNKSYFVSSAKGDLADLEKDIDDALKRAKNDQKIRLMGNILEFSFNLGQLQALDAPTAVKNKWEKALVALDKAITVSSDTAADLVAGDATTSTMTSALNKVQSKVDALYAIVALVS